MRGWTPPSLRQGPDLQTVLDALDDADCRRILKELDVAMTANEISEACDMPLSTTYRKLELLKEATLVEEETRIRDGGHHSHEYVTSFEAIQIALAESRDLDISIEAGATTADEQLTTIWSVIREEL